MIFIGSASCIGNRNRRRHRKQLPALLCQTAVGPAARPALQRPGALRGRSGTAFLRSFHRLSLPFTAFHCLSLPFTAFHRLSLPFTAFHRGSAAAERIREMTAAFGRDERGRLEAEFIKSVLQVRLPTDGAPSATAGRYQSQSTQALHCTRVSCRVGARVEQCKSVLQGRCKSGAVQECPVGSVQEWSSARVSCRGTAQRGTVACTAAAVLCCA